MRKRIIETGAAPLSDSHEDGEWLDLEKIAVIEVTSEEPSHPIESALIPQRSDGWRASAPGEQIIRLLFDTPQALRRVHLIFAESNCERQQEFTISWSRGQNHPVREIVRQQYHFSVNGSAREIEDYRVELKDVGLLELKIIPDRSGGPAPATLACLRLA